MAKIFVTRLIPQAGLDLLKAKGFEVQVNPKDKVLKKKELISIAKGAAGLLCLLADKIDYKIIKALLPELKIIANFAVGFDNIDVKAAKKLGIVVTNTPSEKMSETVAEHTVALLFGAARRLVEADRLVRKGKFKGWHPTLLLGVDIAGKTLGIVGLGRIGAALARRVHYGFGLKIIYYDTKRNLELEQALGIQYVGLEQLLGSADFVSLHVPLLPETHHLIGERELGLMKKTAILINTSRGPVIDEAALVKALQEKRIRAAALDVFENEPKLSPGLAKLDNVLLAPHIGSATEETRAEMSKQAAENLLAFFAGRTPPNLVQL